MNAQDAIATFSVRLPRRVVAGLDTLRPAFGDAPRAAIIRMACERLLADCRGSE